MTNFFISFKASADNFLRTRLLRPATPLAYARRLIPAKAGNHAQAAPQVFRKLLADALKSAGGLF